MRGVALLALGALVGAAACGDDGGKESCTLGGAKPCQKLSSYGLFADIPTQTPADRVTPYDLNTPLFSDYTTKHRFIYLPDGTALAWDDDGAFALPEGAALVKTFGYLHDRRDPAQGETHVETRLLVRTADGITPLTYVYDADQQDATLELAGAIVDSAWIHDDGTPRTNAYVVPNQNQCKSCHGELGGGAVTPLGLKARHINRGGQLEGLVAAGALTGAPADSATWPKAAVALDPTSGTVEERARAYLDITCAHCHNPTGMARTSGLFLDHRETDASTYGVCKAPVATGIGSGGRPFDIVPGMPGTSIMDFRLQSTEPAIKMPELGRNLVDAEGVALIDAWISSLTGTCTN